MGPTLQPAGLVTGDAHDPGRGTQTQGVLSVDAVAEPQQSGLLIGQLLEQLADVVPHAHIGDLLLGRAGLAGKGVDQAQIRAMHRVAIQAERFPGSEQHLADVERLKTGGLRQLQQGGITPVLLAQPMLGLTQAMQLVDHGGGQADRAPFHGNGLGKAVADPPGGVGGEAVAAGGIEALHGLDQTDGALLDQILKIGGKLA